VGFVLQSSRCAEESCVVLSARCLVSSERSMTPNELTVDAARLSPSNERPGSELRLESVRHLLKRYAQPPQLARLS
jgi:hypothetical protein